MFLLLSSLHDITETRNVVGVSKRCATCSIKPRNNAVYTIKSIKWPLLTCLQPDAIGFFAFLGWVLSDFQSTQHGNMQWNSLFNIFIFTPYVLWTNDTVVTLQQCHKLCVAKIVWYCWDILHCLWCQLG
jgi:hypothetical protein